MAKTAHAPPAGVGAPPGHSASAAAAHAVWAILFLTGIASSLAWNVFVTAQKYFQERLKNTPYEESFVNWFSTGFFITTLLAMLVRTVFIADKMPGPIKTIFSAEIVMLSIMFGHTMLTRMPEFHGVEFFKLTMASIVVVGTANTLMQDGLLRLVSTFPPRYTQAVVSGQAMAGVVVAVSNFVILAANGGSDGDDTEVDGHAWTVWRALAGDADLSAFVYFVFVFIVVLLSTVAFIGLTRMQLFRHYHHHHSHPSKNAHKDKPYLKGASESEHGAQARQKLLDQGDKEANGESDSDDEEAKELYLIDLAYKIRFHGATVFLVFCFSVAVFPGLTSLLHSNNPTEGRVFRDLFVPAGFVLFNTGDLLGRWTAGSVRMLSGKQLLAGALARGVFCPLLMFCNLQNQHNQVISLVIFKSDVFPALFMFACAYTNGLFSTQALMQYPRQLSGSNEKELGGTIMFFLLSMGLCAGALLSFVLLAMLKP